MALYAEKNGIVSSGESVLDIENATNSWLSLTNANFGAYDRAKYAIELILKYESVLQFDAGQSLYRKTNGLTPGVEFGVNTLSTTFRTNFIAATTSETAQLVSTASFATLNVWYHFLFYFDSANATPNDRMKMFVNGTQITAFDARTNPTAATRTTTSPVLIGSPSTGNSADFELYRASFFSGSLPSFSDLVNTTTRIPKNISGVSGLYSLVYGQNGIAKDPVRNVTWTNNNGVTVKNVPTVRIP